MKLTKEQQKTVSSFTKLDDHTYTLVCENEYGLEEVLQNGISSTPGLLRFMVRRMRKGGGSFACSSFNAFDESGQFLGRNFDYLDAPLIVVWTRPKNGYRSVSVANCTFMLYGKKNIYPMKKRRENRLLFAPYCCMDGINEKGLAIAVLEIKTKATKQKTGKTPLTTTTVIRAVLDRCATVEEAVDMFKKYDMNDAIFTNYHFHITDNNGKSVIIEYVDNEIRVLATPTGGLQCLTNYFLSEGGDNKKGFGYERNQYISETVAARNGTLTEAEGMKLLENCHLNYKHKRGYQIITLWSCVYHSANKTATLFSGLEYEHGYRFAVDKPGEVEKVQRTPTDIPDFDFPHIDKEMV